MPWPDAGLRRACVSDDHPKKEANTNYAQVNSFGFGGSNAFVILDDALHYLEERGIDGLHRTVELESYDERPAKKARLEGASIESCQPPQLLTWSAADETTLNTMLDSYGDFVHPAKGHSLSSSFIPDVAYTLTAKRTKHPWRSYAVAGNSEDLESLEKWTAKPTKANDEPGSVAFVFTGQGAQYPRMGYELLAFPFFQSRLTELEEILHGLGYGCSLRGRLNQSNECFHSAH